MAGTPLWRAIAEALRRDIAEGGLAPGDRLPTEAVLASRFGVNRHTVRRAFAQLTEEGLVYTRRGAGAFVLGRPTDYPIGRRVRFHQSLLAAGRRPERRLLSLGLRASSAGEAARLALAPGETVCDYQGLSFVDGQPVALFHSLYPEARLPGLAAVLETEPSVTRAFAAVGVADYTRASTRLRAVAAGATEALHLRLPEGAPLLYASSVNVDAAGRPVEFGRTWFASDRITLTLGEDERG